MISRNPKRNTIHIYTAIFTSSCCLDITIFRRSMSKIFKVVPILTLYFFGLIVIRSIKFYFITRTITLRSKYTILSFLTWEKYNPCHCSISISHCESITLSDRDCICKCSSTKGISTEMNIIHITSINCIPISVYF